MARRVLLVTEVTSFRGIKCTLWGQNKHYFIARKALMENMTPFHAKIALLMAEMSSFQDPKCSLWGQKYGRSRARKALLATETMPLDCAKRALVGAEMTPFQTRKVPMVAEKSRGSWHKDYLWS